MTNELKKESSLLAMGTGAMLGHVAQNVAASRMLNHKGGLSVAREIATSAAPLGVKNSARSFFNGVTNAVMPEKAIAKDHLSELLTKLPGMSRMERIALYNAGKGNFLRIFNSGIIEKFPRVQKMLAEKGIPIEEIARAKKSMPREGFDRFVKAQEKIFADSPVGKFSGGLSDGLKGINLNRMGKMKPEPSMTEAAGEVAGNIGIGVVEPGIAMLNAAKRIGADMKVSPGSLKEGYQESAKKMFIDPMMRRSLSLAEQGRSFGPIEGTARKYVMNPVTYEVADYANKARVMAQKTQKVKKVFSR